MATNHEVVGSIPTGRTISSCSLHEQPPYFWLLDPHDSRIRTNMLVWRRAQGHNGVDWFAPIGVHDCLKSKETR